MNKKILVIGDLVWDTHIARLQFDAGGYHQPHLQSHLQNRHGGAWYLQALIKNSIASARAEADANLAKKKDILAAQSNAKSKPEPNVLAEMEKAVKRANEITEQFRAEVLAPTEVPHVDIEEGSGNCGGVAKGFSVWEWFEANEKPAKKKLKNGKIEIKWREGEALPGAWRIKEFLGCQSALWEGTKEKPLTFPPIITPVNEADILVIDDLGLGFATHEACWPANFLATDLLPAEIIIKATPPFDGPLWRKLFEPKWARKTTVVVAAEALRENGARLSRGLSWDQAVQEIQTEFVPGGTGWPLRHCRRIIVLFGRSGAAVFSREPRAPNEEVKLADQVRFERFVFDPANLENTWRADLAGKTFGAASAMTAKLATEALMKTRPSSHLTVSRGLTAARELHCIGGGYDEKNFQLKTADEKMFLCDTKRPETIFRSAFPRDLMDEPVLFKPGEMPKPEGQTLLTDALGLTTTFLTVAAQDIVRRGKEGPLDSVPHLECGKYFTVDREEIERLNTVRNLILNYRASQEDRRPLSLAVFGPPGSGKSFAIKELAEDLFGKDRAVLEFNLSQFENLNALHEAFHQVRDKSVQGSIPFVFWDEFDSARNGGALGWLKEFLAPMQDSKFIANGHEHPFGKCIFIFAGGTKRRFDEFDRSRDKDGEDFRQVKGPDFVSRLRGFVNIKGPNPINEKGDEVYVIRRALLLRSLIERHHKRIIDPVTKQLTISSDVLDAFLRVGGGNSADGFGYLHGARSMEAIVSLSHLQISRRFGPSELPARDVVQLHVSADFLDIVGNRGKFYLSPTDVDQLARTKHTSWLNEKQKPFQKTWPDGEAELVAGYVYGDERNDDARPPTHPLCKPYDELEESGKEGNRLPARLAVLRLEALGYQIVPQEKGAGITVAEEDIKILGKSEHRRWMREKLLKGVAFAPNSSDELLLHKDICKFAELEKIEQQLDHEIINSISRFLAERGLMLIKKPNAK